MCTCSGNILPFTHVYTYMYLIHSQLYGADVVSPDRSEGEEAVLPASREDGPLVKGK